MSDVTPASPPSERSQRALFRKAVHAVAAVSHKDEPRVVCNVCQSLELTVDNFIIDGQDPDLADRPAKRPRTTVKPRRLGTLRELSERANMSPHCPLCKLLVATVTKAPGMKSEMIEEQDKNAVCEVRWVLDGRDLPSQNANGEGSLFKRRTRRLCVEWDGNRTFQTAYIVLIAPNGRFEAEGEWDINGTWQPPTLFLGRRLTSVKDLRTTDLIERWYRTCSSDSESHKELCSAEPELTQEFEDKVRSCSFFFVIDVQKSRIVPLPKGEKYFALSYTWGADAGSEDVSQISEISSSELLDGGTRSTQRIVTLESNVGDHCKDNGIPVKDLPKTIRNALSLTDRLGCRYLWVDSLCIIQQTKNHSIWKLNSNVMDLVYGCADLTICAADGDNDRVGLGALTRDYKVNHKRVDSQVIITYQSSGSTKAPLELMLSFPAEAYIGNSVWDSRGWTFQERVLSKRCLIFADGRVYYQCHAGHMSEDIYAEDAIKGWSVDLLEAPTQIFRDLKTKPLEVWKKSLEMYTSRDLRKPGDILAAFSGLSRVICKSLGGQPVYGLPNSHFDWALLWEPLKAPRRRHAEDEAELMPSWSWCGWEGGKMRYDPSTVDFLEQNLHEWIQDHTWIEWYIRAPDGGLRLVWDYQLETVDTLSAAGPSGPTRGYKKPTEPGCCDLYGRPGRAASAADEPVEAPAAPEFKKIIMPWAAQNKIHRPGKDVSNTQDQGDYRYLQFKTYSAKFWICSDEDDEVVTRTADDTVSHVNTGLHRYFIIDHSHDAVGTIVLDKAWASNHLGEPQEFIAISDAKDIPEKDWKTWTFYIERTRKDADWAFYHVLLLTYERGESGIAERAGLGKVFKDAFGNAVPELVNDPSSERDAKNMKEIILG